MLTFLIKIVNFLLTVAVTFVFLLALTFFIGRIIPIDPVLSVVGDRASLAQYEAARIAMGLDQPLFIQFIQYITNIVQGDWGVSISTNRPVADDLKHVFPATLELATLGIIIGVFFGVPLGVFSAVHQGHLFDQIIRIFALMGYAVPAFWLGLMGLTLFYGHLGWLAGPGRIDIFYQGMVPPLTHIILIDSALAGQWDVFINALEHLILPSCILGFYSLAYIARMTRSFMLDQLNQEYIITAKAKGLSQNRIIWGHAFRCIRLPLATVIGLSYAGLLEGSVMIETVFSWPGIGHYLTTALFNADMNAVLGATLIIGFVFIFINRLTDLLHHHLDPRSYGPNHHQDQHQTSLRKLT